MSTQSESYQPVAKEEVALIGTEPVPAGPYYRADYFELEREAIFRRSWLQIGHMSELPEPGSFMVRQLEIANASILIVRGKDGEVRAFHNVCTHRGTQLVAQESGTQFFFRCPYHSWTFSDEGELRSAPDFDQFFVEKSQCALPKIAVDVCAGLIFVNLEKSPAQSLRDYLGPLAGQLETLPVARATTFSEYTYDIDANWKLTYDNFQENYHLRYIHPRSGAAASGPENPFGYPLRYGFHGPHRTQTIWSNPAAVPGPLQGFAFGKAAGFAMADGIGNMEQAFVESWAVAGTANRARRRLASDEADRVAFFNAAKDLAAPALELLDQKPLDQLDDKEKRLMRLLLSLAHVALAVEIQGDDEPKHARDARFMKITRASADFEAWA